MWNALFPGQGSQRVGMGRHLFDNFDVAKRSFEEASDTLKIDFKKLCFEGPESDLQLTQNTQPALLLVSVATFETVKSINSDIKFEYSAGHSVGEYAACVTTGCLKFADALRAVRHRGEFMQQAVPVGKGGMVAVMGLTPQQVEQMCNWAEKESGLSPLEPANFNAPGQIVCSGSQKLISWLKINLKKEIFDPAPAKLRLIPLKVSAPFHCSLMKPAEANMKTVLNDIPFESAQTPIVQNFTASAETEGETIRKNLIHQISGPVRWIESVELMSASPEAKAIEFGAGTLLKGLVAKIAGDKMPVLSTQSLEDLKTLEKEL